MKNILKLLVRLIVACGIVGVSTIHKRTEGFGKGDGQTNEAESHEFSALFIAVPGFIARLDPRSNKLPKEEKEYFDLYDYSADYGYPSLWPDQLFQLIIGEYHPYYYSAVRISRWKEISSRYTSPSINAVDEIERVDLPDDHEPFAEPSPLPSPLQGSG